MAAATKINGAECKLRTIRLHGDSVLRASATSWLRDKLDNFDMEMACSHDTRCSFFSSQATFIRRASLCCHFLKAAPGTGEPEHVQNLIPRSRASGIGLFDTVLLASQITASTAVCCCTGECAVIQASVLLVRQLGR